MKPVTVIATGMVTGVGLDAPSSCAAIRCAIDNFHETRFVDRGGEWVVGSEVPLDPPARGRAKIVRMAASAIRECLETLDGTQSHSIPLLLAVAEKDRPGRFDDLGDSLIESIAEELNVAFSTQSSVIENGPIGGAQAVSTAIKLLNETATAFVLVAGVDSLMVGRTLAALDREYRLLTPNNTNGLIPGEGGGAVLLSLSSDLPTTSEFVLRGVGYGEESATITSEEPLRGDGLSDAIRDTMSNSGCTYDDVDYRITDISGEQYAFKEATLAAARTMKTVKEEFDIWHTADCIGDIGAAIVPCMIAVAKMAAVREYSKGDGVLFHCANDDEQRAAIIGQYRAMENTDGK